MIMAYYKVCFSLLFLIYMIDLHQVAKHTEIHHFVDDTNLLCSSKSHKDINQKIHFELKNIVRCLWPNEISLNPKKTKIVTFRIQKTITKKNMNFRIIGQKINTMKESKYLGIKMDEHLTFRNHLDIVKLKLYQANGLLAKFRHYINSILLRTIYYVISGIPIGIWMSIMGPKTNTSPTKY